MIKLFNNFREYNKLNESQLGGIITCIPKGDKIRNELKNWRPITLLNSTYKLSSAILANCLKQDLNKLIYTDQKGFVKDRFIGENIRLTYDIIDHCNKNKINGLIVLIDYEKAFDSINWDFITKTLKLFNIGDNIIQWITSLQVNSYSHIVQNGNMSKKVLLHRGCRQGDPVSPYIFVLAAEIMAAAIRENADIKGINIFEREQKISLYADDTMLYLAAQEKSLNQALSTLQEFKLISGLKINIEKTKIIKIGAWGDSRTTFCQEFFLIWTTDFTSLGITFDTDNMNRITEINSTKIWTPRLLTPLGKITIIKSLLISKFTHILLSLPSPKSEKMAEIEKTFQNFLWGSKPRKF